jgi:hypothetical protein
MGLHGIKKSAEQRKQHWVLNDALLWNLPMTLSMNWGAGSWGQGTQSHFQFLSLYKENLKCEMCLSSLEMGNRKELYCVESKIVIFISQQWSNITDFIWFALIIHSNLINSE